MNSSIGSDGNNNKLNSNLAANHDTVDENSSNMRLAKEA
jgi:hypothetical protein